MRPPPPRSLGAELGSIDFAAMARAQADAQAAANRRMIQDALKATDQIAGKLDNESTRMGRAALATAVDAPENMMGLAGRMDSLAASAEGDVDPTEIERILQERALADLSLGRSLSEEQSREVTQGTRQGLAARGMATGEGALASEILNRDRVATSRDYERRNAAAATNQMVTGNRGARMSLAGNLLGQASGANANAAATASGMAQSYVALDPYQRALGSNIPIASQGPSAQMTSQMFSSALGYAGDLYNTNNNAAWSQYLGNQNMAFSERMGNQQMAAQRGANNSALMGAGIGAAGGIAAAGLIVF